MVNKVKIINLKDNSQGYKYNVQIWVNGYYTGNGRFFKNRREAIAYARQYMRSH